MHEDYPWRGMGGEKGQVNCSFQSSRRLLTLNFPIDSCKFLTAEIMGAQNFNSDPKFLQNEGFSAQIYRQENFLPIFQQPKI